MTVDELTMSEDLGETAPTSDPKASRQHSALRSFLSTARSRWCSMLVLVVLVGSAAVLTTVYLTQYQVMRQTGAAVEQAAVAAASSRTVALLSYAPDTIDADLATAKSQMTGEFLTYYGKFTTDVVAPAVRDRGVKASARAVDAAVMEIRPTEAKVLVFLDQETVSRDRPEPAYTASSVIVSLAKVDGEWLISAFDPV
ncbi:hypothetical protein ACEWX3_04855 [Mycobacterium sp. G7A2]|uniref:hypothetical protein n=1 Tax=Mycobacterium sp. G7A2 TaxID=3317307 RepID=UPI0035A963AF